MWKPYRAQVRHPFIGLHVTEAQRKFLEDRAGSRGQAISEIVRELIEAEARQDLLKDAPDGPDAA